jgi:membrane-associated phospholipid phosphatase
LFVLAKKKYKMPQPSYYYTTSLGFFPEGSIIDNIDKQISFLIFSLDFGTLIEALLAGPFGMWFGAPLTAWTIYPILMAWLAEHHLPYSHLIENELIDGNDYWTNSILSIRKLLNITTSTTTSDPGREMLIITILCFTITSMAFYSWLWNGQAVKLYLLTQKLMVPCTTLSFVFAGRWAPIGVRTASFYLVAWVIAETVGFILKISAARRRPGATGGGYAEQLDSIRRSFPELQHILRKGESAIESFPSGDTIGSACFASTLVVVLGYSSTFFTISLLTAFCRMYFHAHHLLDVIVGWLIGHFCTVALAKYCETYLKTNPALAFDAWFAAGTVTLFILFHVVASTFKPKLPKELMVVGRKGF